MKKLAPFLGFCCLVVSLCGCTAQKQITILRSEVKELHQEVETLRKEIGITNNRVIFLPHE